MILILIRFRGRGVGIPLNKDHISGTTAYLSPRCNVSRKVSRTSLSYLDIYIVTDKKNSSTSLFVLFVIPFTIPTPLGALPSPPNGPSVGLF